MRELDNLGNWGVIVDVVVVIVIIAIIVVVVIVVAVIVVVVVVRQFQLYNGKQTGAHR